MSTDHRRALRQRAPQAAAFVALCVAPAACGAPAVSASAGEWTTSTTPISPGIPASTGPAFLVAGGRGVIATWEAEGKEPEDPMRAGRLAVASAHAFGQGRVAVAAPQRLKGGGAVQLEASKAATWDLSHLALRWFTPDGATERTLSLGSAGPVLSADLAVDPGGRILVGWVQLQGTPGKGASPARVVSKLASFAAGSTAPKVRTLRGAPDAPTDDVQIAVALDGEQALAVLAPASAQDGRRQILATTGSLNDAPKPLKVIATKQWSVGGLDAALVRGRPVIAWGEQHHGEEAESPWRIHAAVGTTNGFGFGTPRVLDTGTARAFPPTYALQLVGRPDGTAALAWSQAGPNGNGVTGEGSGSTRAAFLKGAAFGAPAKVADGAFGGLALRADGGPLVLTASTQAPPTTSGPGAAQITAALSAASERAFGPSEPVAAGLGEYEGRATPVPAFDAAGRPVIGWVTTIRGKATLSVATGPLVP